MRTTSGLLTRLALSAQDTLFPEAPPRPSGGQGVGTCAASGRALGALWEPEALSTWNLPVSLFGALFVQMCAGARTA